MKKSFAKPNPKILHPVPNHYDLIFPANLNNSENVIIGDFTYIRDSHFKEHTLYHYKWMEDKLVIGKFCQIGKGIEFIMNGANHQMKSATTYPFYIFNTWQQERPNIEDFSIKGDTIIGNDVWIGQNVTVLPGIKIGDGAIIGMNSVVSKDIPPYTIAAGNPIKIIKKRFDDEIINLLLKYKWWDQTIEKINDDIPMLTCNDDKKLKEWLKNQLH